MALQACGVLPNDEKPFAKDFQFTLYYAAPSAEEAIGIELLKHYQSICEKQGLTNFKLVLRLGDAIDKGPRWDQAYIEKELKPLAGQIRKLYACGAPSMNEIFDKALAPMISDLKLDPKDLEIL